VTGCDRAVTLRDALPAMASQRSWEV